MVCAWRCFALLRDRFPELPRYIRYGTPHPRKPDRRGLRVDNQWNSVRGCDPHVEAHVEDPFTVVCGSNILFDKEIQRLRVVGAWGDLRGLQKAVTQHGGDLGRQVICDQGG